MASKQLERRVGNLDSEHDEAAIERGLPAFANPESLKVYPTSVKP